MEWDSKDIDKINRKRIETGRHRKRESEIERKKIIKGGWDNYIEIYIQRVI